MTLTRKEIESMEAGKEMDALVAKYIFGIADIDMENANCPYCGSDMWHGKVRSRCTSCNEWRYSPYKEYSADILCAWEIIEKFDRKMWDIAIESRTEDDGAVWMAYFTEYFEDGVGRIGGATADTAPLAICRAALIAFMEQE